MASNEKAEKKTERSWIEKRHGAMVQPERWSRYIREVVTDEVAVFVDVVMVRLLPTFASVDQEVGQRAELMYEQAMNRTDFDPDDPPEPGDIAEWAQDSAMDWGFGVHQAFWSSKALFAAGLYHLFEQHAASVLWLSVEKPFEIGVTARFAEWLTCIGIEARTLPEWSKVTDELKHVAKVTKHAEGRSAKALRKLRPEFFNYPGIGGSPGWARRPLAADGLYIPDEDFRAYGESITRLWSSVADRLDQLPEGQLFTVPAD